MDVLAGLKAVEPEDFHVPNVAAFDLIEDAIVEIESLRQELSNLKEGRTAVMPQTKEHAEILLAVAEACYYGNDKIKGFAPRKPKP